MLVVKSCTNYLPELVRRAGAVVAEGWVLVALVCAVEVAVAALRGKDAVAPSVDVRTLVVAGRADSVL